jgi:translation initiation factor IF-3
MRARVNGQITASPVRVVSQDGADLGVHSIADALKLVLSRKEDLVEVEPAAVPPVCQAIDYGKYQYRLQQSGKKKGRN